VATISSLLADHVNLQVRSVDRLFLQGYVPRLMTEGQVIRFLLDRGFPIPSPAVLGKIGRGYVDEVNRFIVDNEIPTVKFVKGDVKEQIAREHFKRAESDGRYGVVMVGIAQERTSAWRGWRHGGPDGHPHFVYRRQSIFPNNYYFYIRDPDWGPSFIKSLISYCTSCGCWGGLWCTAASAALMFDEPGVAGCRRFVESVVAVVDRVVGEQAGAFPVADRDGVNAELVGELGAGEQSAGAEALAVAGEVVLAA